MGEDLGGVASRVASGEPISFGHAGGNIAGRRGPQPLLTAEDDWRSRLPPGSQETFERQAGWLNRRYGYARQPESGTRWMAGTLRRDDPPI